MLEHANSQKIKYMSVYGGTLFLNISSQELYSKFGVFHKQTVNTPSGKGIIIGICQNDSLWLQLDKDKGVSCWNKIGSAKDLASFNITPFITETAIARKLLYIITNAQEKISQRKAALLQLNEKLKTATEAKSQQELQSYLIIACKYFISDELLKNSIDKTSLDILNTQLSNLEASTEQQDVSAHSLDFNTLITLAQMNEAMHKHTSNAQYEKQALAWYRNAIVQYAKKQSPLLADNAVNKLIDLEKTKVLTRLQLGKIYYFDLDGERNTESSKLAATYFQKAAEAGNAEAKGHLGVLYCYGRGIEKNADKGIALLLESDKEGCEYALDTLKKFCTETPDLFKDVKTAEAKLALGKLYYFDLDGKQNVKIAKLAAIYFQKAAEAGNAEAKGHLGALYFYGRGVEKNADKGIALLLESAKEGCEQALVILQKLDTLKAQEAIYLYYLAKNENDLALSHFKNLMNKFYKAASKSSDHDSPLHFAARIGLTEIIKWFIPAKNPSVIDINELNRKGETVLHQAVLNGHDNLTCKLIDCGADLFIADKSSVSPFTLITNNQALVNANQYIQKVKEYLLQALKNPNTKILGNLLKKNMSWAKLPLDEEGNTLLHLGLTNSTIYHVVATSLNENLGEFLRTTHNKYGQTAYETLIIKNEANAASDALHLLQNNELPILSSDNAALFRLSQHFLNKKDTEKFLIFCEKFLDAPPIDKKSSAENIKILMSQLKPLSQSSKQARAIYNKFDQQENLVRLVECQKILRSPKSNHEQINNAYQELSALIGKGYIQALRFKADLLYSGEYFGKVFAEYPTEDDQYEEIKNLYTQLKDKGDLYGHWMLDVIEIEKLEEKKNSIFSFFTWNKKSSDLYKQTIKASLKEAFQLSISSDTSIRAKAKLHIEKMMANQDIEIHTAAKVFYAIIHNARIKWQELMQIINDEETAFTKNIFVEMTQAASDIMKAEENQLKDTNRDVNSLPVSNLMFTRAKVAHELVPALASNPKITSTHSMITEPHPTEELPLPSAPPMFNKDMKQDINSLPVSDEIFARANVAPTFVPGLVSNLELTSADSMITEPHPPEELPLPSASPMFNNDGFDIHQPIPLALLNFNQNMQVSIIPNAPYPESPYSIFADNTIGIIAPPLNNTIAATQENLNFDTSYPILTGPEINRAQPEISLPQNSSSCILQQLSNYVAKLKLEEQSRVESKSFKQTNKEKLQQVQEVTNTDKKVAINSEITNKKVSVTESLANNNPIYKENREVKKIQKQKETSEKQKTKRLVAVAAQ